MIYIEKSREKLSVDAQTKAADPFAEVENRQLAQEKGWKMYIEWLCYHERLGAKNIGSLIN